MIAFAVGALAVFLAIAAVAWYFDRRERRILAERDNLLSSLLADHGQHQARAAFVEGQRSAQAQKNTEETLAQESKRRSPLGLR